MATPGHARARGPARAAGAAGARVPRRAGIDFNLHCMMQNSEF